MTIVLQPCTGENDHRAFTACIAQVTKDPLQYDLVIIVPEKLQPEWLWTSLLNLSRHSGCWSLSGKGFSRYEQRCLYKLHSSQTRLSEELTHKNFGIRLNSVIGSSREEIRSSFTSRIETDLTEEMRQGKRTKPQRDSTRPARRTRLGNDATIPIQPVDDHVFGQGGIDNDSNLFFAMPDLPAADPAAWQESSTNSTRKDKTPRIKEEMVEHEWIRNVPAAERVNIFVGKSRTPITVLRVDLDRSPMLKSWVTDDTRSSFIMRPLLHETDHKDFEAVVEFIHKEEYAPELITAAGEKLWFNTKEYSEELVRMGRLYRIAQQFGIKGMPEKILEKVVAVDDSRFKASAFLYLATVLLDNKLGDPAETYLATIRIQLSSTTIIPGPDPLEDWVIARISNTFKQLMYADQSLFWDTERKTSQRLLSARVYHALSITSAASGRTPESIVRLD